MGKRNKRKQYLAEKREKEIKQEIGFLFEEPEGEHLFDPNWGLVIRNKPESWEPYLNTRLEGAFWLFNNSSPKDKIEKYVRDDIERLFTAMRLARGLILGAIHDHSHFIQKTAIRSLLGFSINDLTINPQRSVYLGKNKDATQEIGRKLYEVGGHSLMIFVGNELVPFFDRSELDICWNGIGEWRC